MRKYNQNSGFGPVFSAVTAMMSPAHQTITRQPLYERIEPLAVHPGLKTFTSFIFGVVGRWHQRANERRALTMLDDHLLDDIGIQRYQAMDEGAKPFWRA